MCQENYTTKNKKYKRLKESEHGIIQECLNRLQFRGASRRNVTELCTNCG